MRRLVCSLVSSAIALLAASTPAPCSPAAERAHPRRQLVLAELQVWHGLPSHSPAFSGADWTLSRAYDSRDRAVVSRQIARAKASHIDGFVVDWYGPKAGVANDIDRAFMDEATAALFEEAEAQGFKVALLYDEGTLPLAEPSTDSYLTRAIADLRDAQRCFSSPAYLRLQGRPALFVFPYPKVDPYLDWTTVRGALQGAVTLIDKDPDPSAAAHDVQFDGFFAWVAPTGGSWDPDGMEWGKEYLRWFYRTMRTAPYAGKLAVGGVWPGFDDSLAPWGSERFISRQGRSVWDEAWAMASKQRASIVMIATWNDFEEGTDVEFGIRMAVDMEAAASDVLIRSSPLQVNWDPSRGDGIVQVYSNGTVIYELRQAPGGLLFLQPEQPFEIKVWVTDCPTPLTKTVKIRRQDPLP